MMTMWNQKIVNGSRRTLFTLFLLLVSTFSIFALSNDLRINPAFAINESPERDSLRNLQDGSTERFVSFEEISNSFGGQVSGNSDSNIYENEDFGISMQVPSDWQEVPSEEMEGFLTEFRPSDRQDVYFAIFVYDLEDGITRDDLNDNNLQGISEAGGEIINSGPIDIAGGNIPAFFIEYKDYNDEGTVTAVSAMMNGNEYYIEFGGTPGTYGKYLSDAEQMVNSFGILDYSESNDAGSGDFGQGFGQDQGFRG